MPTTIDDIQIQIVSNGSEAAANIRDIGAALKEIKSYKSTEKAIAALESISQVTAHLSQAGSAGASLKELADGLSALSGVKSIGTVANNIEKLRTATEHIINSDLSGAGEKFQQISTGLESLTHLSTSGFSRAISSLNKIPEVIAKLDENTISEFTSKVTALSDAMEPLSQKMTTVSSGFKNINKESAGATVSIQDFDSKISTITWSSIVSGVESLYSMIKKIGTGILDITSDIIDLDGICERFQRGFGKNTEESYAWIQRLNKEMGINVQQFMQYSSIFSQMLEGLGVSLEDSSKMAIGYSELAYDIWAAYNDIYESYGDAVSAVQSAIAGQTRPIRKAGFSVLNSTLQQTAANHGLEISISQATEAEKSYLRYLSLVDQAHEQGIVGTYAKEMNTAEGMLRTLGQEVKSLAQELGNLFLPLLTKALPMLQAAVSVISDLVKRIASMFGITIKTPVWDSSVSGFTEALEDGEDASYGIEGAIGGAAEEAKKLKNTILAIDEINALNSNDSSSKSGSAGSGSGISGFGDNGIGWDVDSLWTDAIFENINRQVDDIKKKLENMLPLIKAIALAAGGISMALFLTHLGDAISKLPILDKALATTAVMAAEVAIEVVLTKKFLETGSVIDAVGEILTAAAAGVVLSKVFKNGKLGFGIALGISAVASSFTLGWEVSEGGVDKNNAIKQGILSALQGVFGGALIGFNVGGLTGAAIGAVIGLAVTVAASIIGFKVSENTVTQEEINQNLKEHFGTVELTDSEVKLMVDNFMTDITDGNNKYVQIRMQAVLDQRESEANIQEGIINIEAGLTKMRLGFDYENLESDVNAWLTQVKKYIESSDQVSAISFAMLGIGNSDLANWTSTQYSSLKEQLEWYTNAINEVMTEGTMTGLSGVVFTIPEERKASMVSYLMGEITDIVRQAAEMQYEAKLTGLKMELDSGVLTAQSLEAFMQGVSESMSEYVEQMGEARDSAIAAAIAKRNETGDWDAYQKELEQINKNWLDSVSGSLTAVITEGVGVVSEHYSSELTAFTAGFKDEIVKVGDDISGFISAGGGLANMKNIAKSLSDQMNKDVDPVARAAVNELMSAFEPQEKDMQDLATSYLAAGHMVPEEVRKGINDVEQLKALGGDARAIQYLLAKELTQSDDFYALLRDTEGAFEGVDEAVMQGIANNLDLIYDAGSNTVSAVYNGQTQSLGELTPTMLQNLSDLGISLAGAIGDTERYTESNAKKMMGGVDKGINEGASDITGPNGSIQNMNKLVQNKFIHDFDIRNFEKYGKNMPSGITSGVNKGQIDVVTSVGKITDGIKQKLDSSLNSSSLSIYGNRVSGTVASGINDNLSAVDTAVGNLKSRLKIDDYSTMTAMNDVGRNLIKGVVAGMESESTSYNTNSRINVASSNLLRATQKSNYISSPSDLYKKEVGKWNVLGIVEGMDDPDALVDPLKHMYKTAKNWWYSNATMFADVGITTESDESREHYMNLKDSNNESNALLREQNDLLRQILEKDMDGSGYGVTGEEMLAAARHINARAGRTLISVEG